MKNFKHILAFLLAVLMVLLAACGAPAPEVKELEAESVSSIVELDSQEAEPLPEASEETDAVTEEEETPVAPEAPPIDEDGTYTSKEDVALYIYTYDHLPANFMTKKDAKNLGWSGGSLEKYAPGMSIGGDVFGNYEGNLPKKKGRTYHECDIDTLGAKSRGAKRIVFSDDGLIYYTDDHYETFTLLYGEE